MIRPEYIEKNLVNDFETEDRGDRRPQPVQPEVPVVVRAERKDRDKDSDMSDEVGKEHGKLLMQATAPEHDRHHRLKNRVGVPKQMHNIVIHARIRVGRRAFAAPYIFNAVAP